jgi:acyl carrier protein
MDKTEILSRVKKVTAQVLKSDQEIDDSANFIFDLGADSLQSIELVAAFEEEFDIEMEEEGALKIQTVSEAADFISQYVNE